MSEKPTVFQHCEGQTAEGQVLHFSCVPEDVDEVRASIGRIYSLDVPTTGRVCVPHGSFGRYTRYDITQHEYAGGGGGYIEVLEIKNPPDGRCGVVINESNCYYGGFTEWATLAEARSAFARHWGNPQDTTEMFPKEKGFIRSVVCRALTPWFYAIGNEHLIGDFAFTEGLQDDPVYRCGQSFVVFDDAGCPAVKTCIGTRFLKRKWGTASEAQPYRLVYWDDGTVWDESGWRHNSSLSPLPLVADELWITGALEAFQRFLAGQNTSFSIDLPNGNKFVGRLSSCRKKVLTAEGEYYLRVTFKDNPQPIEGRVNFKPTLDDPDLLQFVTKRYAQKGKEVEKVEVKEKQTKVGGKKWAGGFRTIT